MKFGAGLRNGTYERLKLAVGQDASIIVHRNDLDKATGATSDYLISLGLTMGDLVRLERTGFAIRGYTKNFWGPGEEGPNGGTVPEGKMIRGGGSRVRWVLVIGDDYGRTDEQA